MIIATAGHVDHGKTSLVRALTGVDTDRLPEEKERGLTIDLGFAYLQTASGQRIGFVDVPGHERFIHNMLCGVAGIDAALLVVAADDGLMPQTLEHLAILDFLEVRHGAIALTKIDRVPAEQAALVRNDIVHQTTGTSLAGTPVFPVSSVTGEGLEALRQRLQHLQSTLGSHDAQGTFRLSVDRSFTLSGAGRIVTGMVVSGKVAEGDVVTTLLAGVSARARTIHAQNAPSAEGLAGQRCALNLAGPEVKGANIVRGDWVVKGDVPEPAQRIDARLRLISGEQPLLGRSTQVHLHLGAASSMARIAMLEESADGSGLVQLVLDRPIGAAHGDRFIIRNQAGTRTIGGGRVINVSASARRSRTERAPWLRAMEPEDPALAFEGVLRLSPAGVVLAHFARSRCLTPTQMQLILKHVPTKRLGSGHEERGFLPEYWERLRAAILETVGEEHRTSPELIAVGEPRVIERCRAKLSRTVMTSIIAELVREGVLVKHSMGIRMPGHCAGLTPANECLWKKLTPLLGSAAQVHSVPQVAAQLGVETKHVHALLEQLERTGDVSRIAIDRFLLKPQAARFAEIVERLSKQALNGRVTVAAFRESCGLGRDRSIEVLEYFDRLKFTRRLGDSRMVLRSAQDLFAGRG